MEKPDAKDFEREREVRGGGGARVAVEAQRIYIAAYP